MGSVTNLPGDLLLALNVVVNSGLLIYIIRVETRFMSLKEVLKALSKSGDTQSDNLKETIRALSTSFDDHSKQDEDRHQQMSQDLGRIDRDVSLILGRLK